MRQIKYTVTRTIIGSEDLYLAVRAAFVARGSSLNNWCIANGVNRQTADRAVRGKTTTRAALQLVERVVAAALPDEAQASDAA